MSDGAADRAATNNYDVIIHKPSLTSRLECWSISNQTFVKPTAFDDDVNISTARHEPTAVWRRTTPAHN